MPIDVAYRFSENIAVQLLLEPSVPILPLQP